MTTDKFELRPFLWKVFVGLAAALSLAVGLMYTAWRAPSSAPAPAAAPFGSAVAQLSAQEQVILDGTAWRDRARGRVAIPIDRAMARVLAAGLPTRPERTRPGRTRPERRDAR